VARNVRFAVLLPVKPPGVGKSRLTGLEGVDRRELATAFALDTVSACLGTPGVARVMVTTDDAAFAATVGSLGADAVPDGAVGLNAALREAAAVARRRWPGLVPVALLADLPALRPADLALALEEVGRRSGASFVIDAHGTGTTLYSSPGDFDPRFGADSAAAHLAAGAVPVAGGLSTLRHDVDDVDDLRAVLELGVGPATRSAAAALLSDAPGQHDGPLP
jgi:2-phospho-L-lactate guanylyltransferase